MFQVHTPRMLIARFQAPSDNSLKEFLIENEGKRCVVVLDVRLASL